MSMLFWTCACVVKTHTRITWQRHQLQGSGVGSGREENKQWKGWDFSSVILVCKGNLTQRERVRTKRKRREEK